MIWQCSQHKFDTGMPIIMGILNVTPDSFSDGGTHATLNEAVSFAHRLKDEGAHIIDVGGESTRPGAQPVSIAEELNRVVLVVGTLAAEGMCVSVDTRHVEVAQACLAAGASIVNDVSGFRDPAMVALVSKSDCGVVVMHMLGEPRTMQCNPHYDNVVAEVGQWLAGQASTLEAAGVKAQRICIDPGPGFGKTADQTLELMRNIHELARLGYPVMAAVSRKSYLGQLSGIDTPQQRDEISAIESLRACELGASVVRAHNVACTKAALADLRPYVFIGLGCNVALVTAEGEQREGKQAMLNEAIRALCTLPDSQLIDISSAYESEPAYYMQQDSFINMVALLRTGLPPKDLLGYLHAIEQSLGRVREIKNGPRTCDLDILDYQFIVQDSDDLTLPHPLLLERDFTVKPFLELRARHVLANGVAVSTQGVRVGWAVRV